MRGEINKTRSQKYKEFKGIWEDYSKALVMKKLKIKYVTYEHFLGRAIAEARAKREKEEENQSIYNEKQPFSIYEEDYGTKVSWARKIQNSPIQEREVTPLEIAIKEYKSTFKINTNGRDVEYTDKKRANSEPALLDVGY